jgi:large subunit ribosomal protein L18
MKKKQKKNLNRQRTLRAHRVRARVQGTSERPRLAVYRSLRSISAQIIDDTRGVTVLSAHQRSLTKKSIKPVEAASLLGKQLAEQASKAGIKQVVFDRRQYRYHGRVRAFAEAAREGGLIF